jgi:hypothetical protein
VPKTNASAPSVKGSVAAAMRPPRKA